MYTFAYVRHGDDRLHTVTARMDQESIDIAYDHSFRCEAVSGSYYGRLSEDEIYGLIARDGFWWVDGKEVGNTPAAKPRELMKRLKRRYE